MTGVYQATTAKALTLSIAPDEHSVVDHFSRAYQKRINQLRQAAAGSNTYRIRSMAASILRSYAGRFSAMVRTVHPDEARSVTLSALVNRTGNLNPRLAQLERVSVRVKRKLGGGGRPIVSFGPARRAYQVMCADMLKSVMPLQPFECLAQPRGADQMTSRVIAALQSGVGDHVVTADVRNCFGSIRKEALTELLPLPGWAVRAIILISDQTQLGLQANHMEPCFPLDEAARQGLPQGASTSGLILSRAILGPTLAMTGFADRLFLYGDNITVVAQSRLEGEQILGTLRSVLQDSPAGPLAIGEHSIRSVREKIELVKYAILPVPQRYGGGFRIVPSPKSYRRFEERVKERAAAGATATEIDQYSRNWIAAFPLWQPNDLSHSYLRMTATLAWLAGQSAQWSI